MRIGIDARLWAETGVGRYIRNLILNLQKIDNKNEYVIFARTHEISDIRAQISGNNWRIVEADIKWHSLKEQYEFPKILNKQNLDLVHFPYFSVPIFYNKPFVVTIHDLIMHHFPTGKASTLPLPFFKAKRIGYSKVINHAVKNSKKIIVPLNAVRDDLVRSLNVSSDKIVVTYEGVDEKIKNQESTINAHGKYFLYVGNAYPHKNLERLIEAFLIFKKNDNGKVKLILVGKDDFFYKRFEKKIKDDSIIFLHGVSDKELSMLYKNSIALISASLMEGFGLPAIEAISSNCLVMVSDIPSFREVLADSAIYFNPLDPNKIAQKMDEVIKNGRKYYSPQMLRAKDRLGLFSWKKMAADTLRVYNSI